MYLLSDYVYQNNTPKPGKMQEVKCGKWLVQRFLKKLKNFEKTA